MLTKWFTLKKPILANKILDQNYISWLNVIIRNEHRNLNKVKP